ncbi:MAG: hypothetical protein QNJ37_20245 [Crocosphaera sp.]|nr:hypothetical protein [Crocosphaera sp.]
MLSSSQQALYNKIQAFSLDKPNANYSYTQRLMDENNWSLDYTKRIIEEYKKFVFLAVISPGSLTPSKIIDKAWHLHLIYTDSYWNQFCPHILGCYLHHDPSHGGEAELEKYHHDYQKTIAIYQNCFGYLPPDDIWCYQQNNRQQNSLIPTITTFFQNLRRQKSMIFSLLLITVFVLSSTAQATASNIQKAGISIEHIGFIYFWTSMFGLWMSASLWIQLYLEPSQRRKNRHNYIPATIMFTISVLGICLTIFTFTENSFRPVLILSTLISLISSFCFLVSDPSEDGGGGGNSGGFTACGGACCGGSC